MKTIKKAKVGLMKLESSIPQWIITTTFLHGLPSSYDSFVKIILNSRDKDANERLLEPEFDEVCDKVLDRERRCQIITSDANNTKALKAAANGANTNSNSNSDFNKNKGKERQRPKCSECNRPHSGDCWLAHPEKATQEWRDNNKNRIADFKKKKAEAKEKKEKACYTISTKDSGFFFDTAASLHYIYSKTWYHEDPILLDDPVEIEACDGGTVYITHIEIIKLNILIGDEECRLSIRDVYYYSEMNTNLLSLRTLVSNGLSFEASKKRLIVTNDERDTIMKGELVNTLFKLRLSDSDDSKAKDIIKAMTAKNPSHKKATAQYWHKTLGHLNYKDLAKLPAIIEGMEIVGPLKKEFCEPCVLGK